MSKEGQFTIEMEQLEGYQFKVTFDLEKVEDLLVDEPPPLGEGAGPNPSRMLTVAAANCLSASLLYCVTKNEPPAGSLKTTATCTLGRNDKGKLRILRIDARLEVNGEIEGQPCGRKLLVGEEPSAARGEDKQEHDGEQQCDEVAGVPRARNDYAGARGPVGRIPLVPSPNEGGDDQSTPQHRPVEDGIQHGEIRG